MKKIAFFFSICFSVAQLTHAQTPNWLWAKSSGGGPYEYATGLSLDNNGHFYMSGRCADTINFNGVKLAAYGLDNVFLGKFDTSSLCTWLTIDSLSYGFDYPFGFCRDNRNNAYSCGMFYNNSAGYITKCNSSGALKWTVTLGNYNINPYGVVADDNGNIYVAGSLQPDSVVFGATVLSYTGSGSALFITKLDSNGNFIWAKSAYGTGANDGYTAARGIAIDNSHSNIYIMGSYTGAPNFDSLTVPPVSGRSSLIVAKYDTSGHALNLYAAPGAGFSNSDCCSIGGIVMDSSNNVYVCSYYNDTATFELNTLISHGYEDMYVAKLNTYSRDWEWANDIGCPAGAGGSVITLDKNGDIYTGGQYRTDTLYIGSDTILQGDIFVAKFANSTGALQWVQTATSNGGSIGGIGVDNKKFVYVDGTFSGTGTLGSNAITAASTANIFIAEMDTVAARTIVPALSANYCLGTTDTIPFTVTGTFNPGNVFTAQLSDSSGAFIYPINLGTDTSTSGGNLIINVPYNAGTGKHYLVRIVSSNPATSSEANGSYAGSYYISFDTCGVVTWPGDANDDDYVNNYDLLPIGVNYGTTGIARSTTSIAWEAQPATIWAMLQADGKDMHSVDCNGDGTINATDTTAIVQNYGLYHATGRPRPTTAERVAGGAPLYFVADSSSYHPGSSVHVAVWLGDSASQAGNLYGLGYDINLNTSIIQAGSLAFSYHNSFIGTKNNDAMTLTHLDNDVETAVTRLNHGNRNGYGQIGDLYFRLQSSVGVQSLALSVASSQAVDSAGNVIAVSPKNDTLTIIKNSAGIKQLPVNNYQVSIYPNPSNGIITVNSSVMVENIKVYNVLGQLVYQATPQQQQFTIELKDEGIYFATVTSGGNVVTKKVTVIR